MATNDRIRDYLGSTKNLTGSACGLLGLVLHFTDAAGAYWPAVVAGLYAAGALAAPPEEVALVVEDPGDRDAGNDELRAELDALVRRVCEHAGRMPPPVTMRLKVIKDRIGELLDRGDLLAAAPHARGQIARVVRVELPRGFETYLNLPGWFAAGRGRTSRRTAADELAAQLALIAAQVTELAERLYEGDAQRMRDQTGHLRDTRVDDPDDLLNSRPLG